MTLVSIVITSYNKAIYLEQAVESVLMQSYSNIECIIVDDGSTDNTEQIVQELIASYPQIKYFVKPNGGISSARNFGCNKDNQIIKLISHEIGHLSKAELINRLLVCPDFLADSSFPLLQQAMLFKKTIFNKYQFNETLKACEDRE